MIIAGTGHRTANETNVRRAVRASLEEIPPWEESIFICGMADGYDLWSGDEARRLGWTIWAARPWATHGGGELYDKVLQSAEKVINVLPDKEFPGKWCYQKRNEWMVDNATHILAWWDGTASGTKNCLDYARGKKPIRNIYGRMYS